MTVCQSWNAATTGYPIGATPLTTLDQFLPPFRVVQVNPPTLAMPALNGPLGFVLAGALAGYWLAARQWASR